MTKIDIFSGFLGAGKTTLIKKLISESFKNEKIVIIENEFGQIGIDGGFLKETGIQITEMNSGCICCSLVGDFGKALAEVIHKFSPSRIIIEPSGVGKLSDVIKATQKVESDDVKLNTFTTVIDALKCKIYLKNFKEFYENQIQYANTIILSRTTNISKEKIDETVALIKAINPSASIITTDWDQLAGNQILDTMEKRNSLSSVLDELKESMHHDAHHHHDDDECDDPDCECHRHEHDDEEHEHHHHHHHNDEECDDPDCECHHHHEHDDDEEHEHHHHHHHDDEECDDPNCECHHHHHHHADEVFESWGVETTNKYSYDYIEKVLSELNDTEKYGIILRSKAIIQSDDNKWIHYDFVPGESNIRYGSSDVTGKICVIGSKLNKENIITLFNL